MCRELFHKYKYSPPVASQMVPEVEKVASCDRKEVGHSAREPAPSGGRFGKSKSIHGLPRRLRTIDTKPVWWPHSSTSCSEPKQCNMDELVVSVLFVFLTKLSNKIKDSNGLFLSSFFHHI